MASLVKMSGFGDVYASTTATRDLPHPVGTVVENQYGDRFMLVKQIGATTSAVGEIAQAATTGISAATRGFVSRTAATSLVNGVSTVALAVGVFQGIAATGAFCWAQISGLGVTALAVTDGGVAAGDPLVVDGGATCVGAVDTMADGEEESAFAFALDADVGTVQAAGSYTLHNTIFG
jgi:hypothetical protein